MTSSVDDSHTNHLNGQYLRLNNLNDNFLADGIFSTKHNEMD